MQLSEILGCSIGERPIGLTPDMLGRVEFRGIGGEVGGMEAGVLADKVLDLFAPVDRAPIPQQAHRPPPMLEQVFEKRL